MWGGFMGEPLLCRLGFHKWQDYGEQVVISWKEPCIVGPAYCGRGSWSLSPDGLPARKEALEPHSNVVYEGKQCKRCGIKLMRRFVKNKDSTLSSVGWEEPHDEETNKQT
jgi:hypothetical protein